jgi:hypothetical protein
MIILSLLPTTTKVSFVLGVISLGLIPFFWPLAIPLALSCIFFFAICACCRFFDPRRKASSSHNICIDPKDSRSAVPPREANNTHYVVVDAVLGFDDMKQMSEEELEQLIISSLHDIAGYDAERAADLREEYDAKDNENKPMFLFVIQAEVRSRAATTQLH